MVEAWSLKLEVFRFWFCFHWIIFFISWELGFSFYALFYFVFLLSITIFTFRLILNDRIWCSFLIFELILLMFWLQNRYKSGILKPKNRFYLCFGYKVNTNYVLLNQRTDWDPNLKVHRVVPVLWRFTNPTWTRKNPNQSRTKLLYNPNGADFDKPENPRPDWKNRNPIGTPNAHA